MQRSNQNATAVLASGAALLVVAGAWTTARGDDEPPAGVGEVQAKSLDTQAPVFRAPADDGPAARPDHPPIALIPPIPMPEPIAGGHGPVSGRVLSHDALTGETIEIAGSLPSGAPGGSGGGYNGADGGLGWEQRDPLAGFADMSLVGNVDEFPWRMNCKMVMRFTDQSGGTRFFTASGSMIDAETVLTAAHCVYVQSANGPDIFDWAEEIWIYPGWDGIGGQFNPPPSTVHNFGFGHGTHFMAGTDYVFDGDPDADCGLIEITRGVGMLTGWYGWTWGFDCSWIQGRLYNNVSFPSENCPIDGLHNGSDMYYWWGSIDSCPDNQMQLDTGGGCFDTVWGGMSGSSMYWIENDYRRVHAICSRSDRDTWGHYCKLWEGFATPMSGSFIPDARGDTFDLQPLDVNAEPAVVQAGGTLTLANFLATNPTNGTASGTIFFGIYLSTNDNISDADTLLSSQNFTWSFGTMSSVTVNMVLPMIPVDTPPGDYWIGVLVDPATDVDDLNNDTDGWDAVPVTVTDHCYAPPNFDSSVAPSSNWQTEPLASLGADGCRVYRFYLYTGHDYDFSMCADDGVGGWADPGDADMRMLDAAGSQMWYIDGFGGCGYDATTLGTTYEGWSPPAHGYYYLEVTEYYDDELTYRLAHKYTSTEHCYAPPTYDLELHPSSAWSTTGIQTIDAPDSCRLYRMYLFSSLDYDFTVCAADEAGGWVEIGDGDFHMRNVGGTTLWFIDGAYECDYDASTIGTVYEGWSPPSDGYYYLEVDDYFGDPLMYELAYRITPGAAPPNDNCWDVTPVSLTPGAPVTFNGVNVGATVDSDLFYPEVWHAFTTAECVDLELAYCDTMPPFGNVYIVLKESCPATGPNVYVSYYDDTSCPDGNYTLYWNELPPGTYWYPVLTDAGSEGPYVIEASASSCGVTCLGDLDGDSDVDFQDLVELLFFWGECPGCPADFDGNGSVDFQDLIDLLFAWGPC